MITFYGGEHEFRFVSDEYNGKNRDAGSSKPRPRIEKRFPSFTAAMEENGMSRVFLGIHWPFDASKGYIQGKAIADEVTGSLLN